MTGTVIMACRKCCEAKYGLESVSKAYHGSGLERQLQRQTVKCCYCKGGSLFVAGQATDCRHCKGTGLCELKDAKYWG